MAKGTDNGFVSLSAVDFLGLTKRRKVARLDLAEVGYEGAIYVRDLTAAEQARVTGGTGRSGRARLYDDKSVEMDMAMLVESAGPKFLAAAVVTDGEGGAVLQRAFDAAGPEAEYITMSAGELVQMSDEWIREAGNRDKMEKVLEQMPNAVTNLVVKRVRQLSGLAGDRIEEKKENS